MNMAQLAEGSYHGKVVGATTIEVGPDKKPVIQVKCDVAFVWQNGAWAELPKSEQRNLELFLSPAAWPYSQKKLTFLGFNGEFENPQFSGDCATEGVALTCSHRDSKDGTKVYEDWDLSEWGGGGAGQVSQDTMHLLNAQWKQDGGYTESPAAPAPAPAPATAPAPVVPGTPPGDDVPF